MKLGDELLKILDRQYEPSSLVSLKYKRFDLGIKTNGEGLPILLFIGKADEKGVVKGERYVRTLKKNREGQVIKDHWDLKGKAS